MSKPYFLRHKLDPVGNPQDFSALVGNTYEPGQYAVLTRGTGQLAQQSLHFGGLWTDDKETAGQKLHEVRREVILYFILLEPATSEAFAFEYAKDTLICLCSTPKHV